MRYFDKFSYNLKTSLLGHNLTQEQADELIIAITARVRARCNAYKEYDGMGCYLPPGHEGNHRAEPRE